MAGKQTIVKDVALKQIFPDIKNVTASTASYSQGDHIVFDSTLHIARAPTAESEGSSYLGISMLDVSSGKPLSPYSGTAVDAAQAVPAMDGPAYGVTNMYVLKTGDSLSPGVSIYIDLATGSRGVASTGTKAIGVYQGAAISGSAAGLEIECLVGARFPNDVLKF